MLHKLSQPLFQQTIFNKKPFSSILTLKPGEILRGNIIQEHADGEITISMQGKLIKAHSEINLSKGTSHYFQVKRTGPVVELKVIDRLNRDIEPPLLIWASSRPDRQKIGNILNELGKSYLLLKLNPATSKAFQKLYQILPAIVFSGNSNDDNLWFSRFLPSSGLFWENKIIRLLLGTGKDSWKKLHSSDLKGILLSLDKCIKAEDNDNEVIRTMALKLEEAVSIIEQDQLLNLSCIKAGMGFCFIPGFTEDGFKGADLFIKEINENDEMYFTLFMEFSMLGKIEMDISVVNSVILIKMLCEDSVKIDFIKENIPILERALHDIGMINGGITCELMEAIDYHINPFSDNANAYPSFHFIA